MSPRPRRGETLRMLPIERERSMLLLPDSPECCELFAYRDECKPTREADDETERKYWE